MIITGVKHDITQTTQDYSKLLCQEQYSSMTLHKLRITTIANHCDKDKIQVRV